MQSSVRPCSSTRAPTRREQGRRAVGVHSASPLRLLALAAFSVFLAACGTPAEQQSLETIDVYTSPAVSPWLAEIFACAEKAPAVVRITGPGTADLALRLGEPEILAGPAFQIAAEDVLIVAHPQSPIQSLTREEARQLFSGGSDSALEIWVFSHDEDVQQIFRQAIMGGSNVTGSARVAGSPQEMLDALNADSHAVGLIPRRWNVGGLRELVVVSSAPVLATTRAEPADSLRDLVHCLQS